jgi:hypothetical protein
MHPDYSSLRVFGCLCYTASTMSHKLAPWSSACVFLRYSSHHKGYRCIDLSTQHILISLHVVFDESTFPFASLLMSFSMMFLLSLFLRLPRTPLRRRLHRRPPRRPHRRPPRRLHRHMRPRPCIVSATPPAYMSLPMSALIYMLLSTGTRRFPPPHVRRSRIPTGSRL